MSLFLPQLALYEKINAMSPASKYIVKLFEQCEYLGQTCLVFEMLDRSLWDHLEENPRQTLSSTRSIAKQVCIILIIEPMYCSMNCICCTSMQN